MERGQGSHGLSKILVSQELCCRVLRRAFLRWVVGAAPLPLAGIGISRRQGGHREAQKINDLGSAACGQRMLLSRQ
jgi:hypothetical protein